MPNTVAAALWLVVGARLPSASEVDDLRWRLDSRQTWSNRNALVRAADALNLTGTVYELHVVKPCAVLVDITQTYAAPGFVTGIQRVVRGTVEALRLREEVLLVRAAGPGRLVSVPANDWQKALSSPADGARPTASAGREVLRRTAVAALLAARKPLAKKIETDPHFANSVAVRCGRRAVRTLYSGRAASPSSVTLVARVGGPMLLPELTVDDGALEALLRWARLLRPQLSMIFYDAIPLTHPHYVPPGLLAGYGRYLELLRRADTVLPISDFAAVAARALVRLEQEGPSEVVHPVPLPGSGMVAGEAVRNVTQNPVLVLCVGSLEPRKNHVRLLRAARLVHRDGIPLHLILVGRRGTQAGAINEELAEARREGVLVDLIEDADDAALAQLYVQARAVALVSEAEGYGLPIVEALAHGTPVLCSDIGSMAEIAKDGGCLLVSPYDVSALASCLHRLLTDDELHAQLVREATSRPERTWTDYVNEIAAACRWTGTPAKASPGAVHLP